MAITAGVSTTASAKLNSSARRRLTPRKRPVEIVAPEREKPRNGKHKPCTAPTQAALLSDKSLFPGSGQRDDTMISTPAAASAAAINRALPNRCSTSKSGELPATTRLITCSRTSPTTPVNAVAVTT